MEILKDIEIKNFRGIKYIKFKPKSINIIVGPNNSGKSAILEAIALFVSFPKDFNDVMGKDIFEYLSRKYGEYMLKTNSDKVEISGKLWKRKYILNLEYYPKGIPSDERGELISKYFSKIPNESSLSKLFMELKPKSQNIDFDLKKYNIDGKLFYNTKKYIISIYNSQNNLKSLHIFMSKEDLEKNLKNITLKRLINDILSILLSIEILRHNTIIGFNMHGFKKYPILFNKMILGIDIEELHDKIIQEKNIEKDINDIIEFIKQKIYYIEDIRKTKDGIYVKISDEYMPLSTMGDGFKTLLNISFITALAKNGILILEEPEISLHPGFLNIVAETMVKSSDSIQLFISTHSLEFLYEILNKAEQFNKLCDVNVIRVYRKRYKPDDVFIEVIDGKDAKERIDDIGEDLRN